MFKKDICVNKMNKNIQWILLYLLVLDKKWRSSKLGLYDQQYY